MKASRLPVANLSPEQVQAILEAHLRRARSLAVDTPAGYLDENYVPVVWDNPQAAALDWQQHVTQAQLYDDDLPSLQIWPDRQLPEPYGVTGMRYSWDPGEPEWDGYYRMGPGYSNLPTPAPVTTALGRRLRAMQNRMPF